MTDYIVRATAAGGAIRAFAITSKELAEQARKNHDASPVITAALGRLLSAGAMMGAMMKGEKDLLTIQVMGDGPAKTLMVTADAFGRVKGYPQNPQVDLPPNEKGKLDVGGAVGKGILRVIKDLGLKEPYVGATELQTGEIAEDLTYYFAASEQTPSAVGLGVLVDKDCSVRRSGGFLLQLMPDTPDEAVEKLEEKIAQIPSVTDMLERGMTPEQMLEDILGGMDFSVTDTIPAAFQCNCSKERITRALLSIRTEDMQSMADDNEPIEIKCRFCNTAYTFDAEEIKAMLAQMRQRQEEPE